MIEIGESTGEYDNIFKKLNYYYSSQSEMKRNIKIKSIYPMIIFAALITLSVVFMRVLEPMYTGLIKQFGGQMPFCTRLLIGIYDFMKYNSAFIVLGIILVIIISNMMKKRDSIKKLRFRILRRVPVVGKFIYLANAYRMFSTFSMLISSGIGIVSAVEIIKNNTENPLIKAKLKLVQNSIIKGRTLKESIEILEIDYQALYLIGIGEETGRLEENIKKLEDIYFKELQYRLKSIEKAVEPVMTIIMAIFVGFFVVAFIQPAYSLITNIK